MILASREIDINFIEYIRDIFTNGMVHPITFIEFILVLIGLFIVRGILLVKIEKNSSPDERKHNIYIFTHVGFELFIAYIISYVCVLLTGGNPKHVGINIFAAPLFGFMMSVLIDMKFITELEKEVHIGIPEFMKKSNKEPTSKKESSDNNITINVGTNQQQPEDNKSPKIFDKSSDLYIDKDEIGDDIFKEKIIDTVNSVIAIQDHQSDIITENTARIDEICSIMDRIKEIDMNDKKLELKHYIYECLNNGFATPEENDIITTKYNSYRDLGGNHEIEALYINHYLTLSVHVDRRKHNNQHYEQPDRRSSQPRYTYGQFDNELIENENRDGE